MSHQLAAGVIVLDGDKVLLVRDDKGWSLPKGGIESGELSRETAIREAEEETGYIINANEVAFVTEYRSIQYGSYLHIYYSGEIIGESKLSLDPEIVAVQLIPVAELREYIHFRPWIIPLEQWINNRKREYYSYNLDEVPAEI